jgi:hypothetical protein
LYLPKALVLVFAEESFSSSGSGSINIKEEQEHHDGRRRPDTSSHTNRRLEEAGLITKSVLDALAQFRSPLNEYNEADWERFQSCLGPSLLNVSDALWAGFLEYGNSNGEAPDDIWGIERDDISADEHDPAPLPPVAAIGYENYTITIMQPCNTVSNLPFYRSMWTLCELKSWKLDNDTLGALKLAFTSLATASTFNHASLTKLGGLVDEYVIALIMLLVHQVSLQGFTNDPILFNLQEQVPLYSSALQMMREFERIILQENVSDWRARVGNLKQETPSYVYDHYKMESVVVYKETLT